MLAGSRLFFNTLSGLLVPEVFLHDTKKKKRGREEKNKKIVRKTGGVRGRETEAEKIRLSE